eukprot:Gb_06704 [translate_table: standard]
MAMDIQQEHAIREWSKSQSISLRTELVSAAKQQLAFLATVDCHPCLYNGPILLVAIRRYEECWLPLLASRDGQGAPGIPLVPPLDCAWIWHCHRLSPIAYKDDCERLFGRLLDAPFVDPSMKDTAADGTAYIWKRRYPQEPYLLDLSGTTVISRDNSNLQRETRIAYDLGQAVHRQQNFYYQFSSKEPATCFFGIQWTQKPIRAAIYLTVAVVHLTNLPTGFQLHRIPNKHVVSGPHMTDDHYLKFAEERYKAFLHLIAKFRDNERHPFFVPTYDIDLIWHSHQLSPVAYRDDTLHLLGRVLNHDDTSEDRSLRQRLDVGFRETRELWENIFGFPYERAGAMYKGKKPSPLPPSELPARKRSGPYASCLYA